MSAKSYRTMPIIYAPAALQDLDAIWNWNEKEYSREHAANYFEFLERRIESLGDRTLQGKTLNSRPDLRYVLIRRKTSGHGHVVVYRIKDKEVNVLHVFHTAQDWQTKLVDEQAS